MAVACLISWAVVPVIRFVKYLASSPRLDRVRNRAITITASLAVGLVIAGRDLSLEHIAASAEALALLDFALSDGYDELSRELDAASSP